MKGFTEEDYDNIKWTPAQKISQSLRIIKEFQQIKGWEEHEDHLEDFEEVIETIKKILEQENG